MLARTLRGGGRPLLAFLVPVGAAVACWAPTQIVVHVETDLPCEEVTRSSVAIVTAGTVEELETAGVVAATSQCTTRDGISEVGTLVLVPSGDRDSRVLVKAVIGVGRSTEECLGGESAGCVVARRSAGFVPHRSLRVGMRLDRACLGAVCGPNETCERGACVALGREPGDERDLGADGDGGAGVLTCVEGRGDCDGDPTNGCEADLRSPESCGSCGRSCGGAACSPSGTCEPGVLVGNLDRPRPIIAAGGHVYVGLEHALEGRILRCPLAGCTTATAVSGRHSNPTSFALDGATLLWADEQQGVFRCTLPDCALPSLVCREGASSIVANGADVILASRFNVFVGRCTPASTNPSYFASPTGDTVAVVKSGGEVFFAVDGDGTSLAGGIDACALPAGCGFGLKPPRLRVRDTGTYNRPTSLAADDSSLYWTELSTEHVMRAPQTLDRSGTSIATGVRPRSVVVDDAHVYWIDEGTGERDGSIHRAAKDGTGHVVLASGERAPGELALGPDTEPVKRIFWTTRVPIDGEVRWVAR